MPSMLACEFNPSITPTLSPDRSDTKYPRTTSQFSQEDTALLQAVVEGFIDGVLILSDTGEVVHANQTGHHFCQQLSQQTSLINDLPEPIWQVCQSLIESRELFPNHLFILDNEISVDHSVAFRIRVRWLELNQQEPPYLLVTLEDKYQSLETLALIDAEKYGLTRRETEVWSLRLANYSYKDIAAQLYITINTVKKHLKNIHAKRNELLWSKELS